MGSEMCIRDRYDRRAFVNVAFHNVASELIELYGNVPFVPNPSGPGGRLSVTKQPVHVADPLDAGDEFPLGREMAIKFGHRTILSVPLIREGPASRSSWCRTSPPRPS